MPTGGLPAIGLHFANCDSSANRFADTASDADHSLVPCISDTYTISFSHLHRHA